MNLGPVNTVLLGVTLAAVVSMCVILVNMLQELRQITVLLTPAKPKRKSKRKPVRRAASTQIIEPSVIRPKSAPVQYKSKTVVKAEEEPSGSIITSKTPRQFRDEEDEATKSRLDKFMNGASHG